MMLLVELIDGYGEVVMSGEVEPYVVKSGVNGTSGELRADDLVFENPPVGVSIVASRLRWIVRPSPQVVPINVIEMLDSYYCIPHPRKTVTRWRKEPRPGGRWSKPRPGEACEVTVWWDVLASWGTT